MPRLLEMCCPSTDTDQWWREVSKTGELKPFGTDVLQAWPSLTPDSRLFVMRAWLLTRHCNTERQKNDDDDEDDEMMMMMMVTTMMIVVVVMMMMMMMMTSGTRGDQKAKDTQ